MAREHFTEDEIKAVINVLPSPSMVIPSLVEEMNRTTRESYMNDIATQMMMLKVKKHQKRKIISYLQEKLKEFHYRALVPSHHMVTKAAIEKIGQQLGQQQLDLKKMKGTMRSLYHIISPVFNASEPKEKEMRIIVNKNFTINEAVEFSYTVKTCRGSDMLFNYSMENIGEGNLRWWSKHKGPYVHTDVYMVLILKKKMMWYHDISLKTIAEIFIKAGGGYFTVAHSPSSERNSDYVYLEVYGIKSKIEDYTEKLVYRRDDGDEEAYNLFFSQEIISTFKETVFSRMADIDEIYVSELKYIQCFTGSRRASEMNVDLFATGEESREHTKFSENGWFISINYNMMNRYGVELPDLLEELGKIGYKFLHRRIPIKIQGPDKKSPSSGKYKSVEPRNIRYGTTPIFDKYGSSYLLLYSESTSVDPLQKLKGSKYYFETEGENFLTLSTLKYVDITRCACNSIGRPDSLIYRLFGLGGITYNMLDVLNVNLEKCGLLYTGKDLVDIVHDLVMTGTQLQVKFFGNVKKNPGDYCSLSIQRPNVVLTKIALTGAIEMGGSSMMSLAFGKSISIKPIVNIPLPRGFDKTLAKMKKPEVTVQDEELTDEDLIIDEMRVRRIEYMGRLIISIPPTLVEILKETFPKKRKSIVEKIEETSTRNQEIIVKTTPPNLISFFGLKENDETDEVLESLIFFEP